MQKQKVCISVSSGSNQKGVNIGKLDFTLEGSTKEDTRNAITRSCNGQNYRMNCEKRRKFIGSQLQNSPFKDKAYNIYRNQQKKQRPHILQKEYPRIFVPKKIQFVTQKLQTQQEKTKQVKLKQYQIFETELKIPMQQKNSDTSQSCQSQGFWVFKTKKNMEKKQQKRPGMNINQKKRRSPTNFKHGSPKPRMISRSPLAIDTGAKNNLKAVRHLRILSEQSIQNPKWQNTQISNKAIPKSENQSISRMNSKYKIKVFSPGKEFGKQSLNIRRTQFAKIFPNSQRSIYNQDSNHKKQYSIEKTKANKLEQKKQDQSSIKFADIKFSYYGQKNIQKVNNVRNPLSKVGSLKNLYEKRIKNSQTNIEGFTFREKPQKQGIKGQKNERFDKLVSNINLFKKTNTPKYEPKGFFFSRKNGQNDINQIKSDPDINNFFNPGKGKLQSHNAQKSKYSSKNIATFSENSKKSKNSLFLNSISLKNDSQVKVFQFQVIRKLEQQQNNSIRVVLHAQTRSIYILKGLKKTPQNIQTFIRESKVQFFIKNKNIVKLYGIFQDLNNLYLLVQYLEDGSLFEEQRKLLKKQIDNIEDLKGQMMKRSQEEQKKKVKRVRDIGKQILKGLDHLHNEGIIHRDIKSHNIFVSNDQYKIGDYGSSTSTNSLQFVGTIDYAAPQIIQRMPYDRSIDIWSLGCVLFQIYAGLPPFYDQQRIQTYRKIINVEYNRNRIQNANRSLANLIDLMLRRNPKQRITAYEALKHQFFEQPNQNILSV